MAKSKRPNFDTSKVQRESAIDRLNKKIASPETQKAIQDVRVKLDAKATKRLNVNVSEHEHTELKLLATKQGKSISEVLRTLVSEYLSKNISE